jgi:hypothetical protein
MCFFTVDLRKYRCDNSILFNKQEVSMKSLGAKFSDTQVLKIKGMKDITGIDSSKISRAALRLGLMQIQALAAKDVDKAIDLVLINDARSK